MKRYHVFFSFSGMRYQFRHRLRHTWKRKHLGIKERFLRYVRKKHYLRALYLEVGLGSVTHENCKNTAACSSHLPLNVEVHSTFLCALGIFMTNVISLLTMYSDGETFDALRNTLLIAWLKNCTSGVYPYFKVIIRLLAYVPVRSF